MAVKALPSQEVLCQILRYETDTGKLFWKERGLEWFNAEKQTREHNAAIWNGKNAGKEAFITALPLGHRYAGIFGQKYLAHRVAWKMAYGTDPIGIDHIDGDPTNNQILNLRLASFAENARNRTHKSNNSSGVRGVTWHTPSRKWWARVTLNDKTHSLGLYKTIDEAAVVVYEAKQRMFGEFARA